jgi:hypothetical protein
VFNSCLINAQGQYLKQLKFNHLNKKRHDTYSKSEGRIPKKYVEVASQLQHTNNTRSITSLSY